MENSARFNFFGSRAYPQSNLDKLNKDKCYKIIFIDRKTIFYGFQIIIIVEGGIEINVPSFKTHPRYYES